MENEIKDSKEEDSNDCYKCICGIATNCNCKHLGIRHKMLTAKAKRDTLNEVLKSLDF